MGAGGGGGGRGPPSEDEEDEDRMDSEEEEEYGVRPPKKKKKVSDFIIDEAEVDDDAEDDEDAWDDDAEGDMPNEAVEAGQTARDIEARSAERSFPLFFRLVWPSHQIFFPFYMRLQGDNVAL